MGDEDKAAVQATLAVEQPKLITQEARTAASPPPYSVFSKRRKWFIISLAGCAGFFSPLAANIYFPAIPTLAAAFGKSTQAINLTVTVYMILQGVTPTLWGTLADSYGRRPVYLCCMTVFIAACIGLALTPTSDYWLLMLLRCLSASGSAVVIALSSGTVSDIAEPSERGTFVGVVTIGPMLGPCIGPVFGGLLNSGFGWRSIFWFMVILATCVYIPIVLWFPETLRSIVGDGSTPAQGINATLWDVITRRNRPKENTPTNAVKAPKKEVNPFVALRYFLEKDVAIVLFFNAVNYTAFYAVTTSLSTIFERDYGLSTSKTGLCYLPIGAGMVISTVTTGRLLDRDFRITKARIAKEKAEAQIPDKGMLGSSENMSVKRPYDHNNLSDFPIEHARLRSTPIYCSIFWSSVVAYGWLVQYKVNLVAPLIFQFIIGYSIVSVMQINQILLVDLYPGKGASVTANNNLCRCLIGAAGIAVVDPIMNAVKPGCTMIIFVGICVVFSPLVLLEWRHGMKWRLARAERVRLEKEAEAFKRATLPQ